MLRAASNDMFWRDMATVPKDETPVLLLAPDGTIGIGTAGMREHEGLKFLADHAAWVGKRYGEDHVGIWIGGYAFEEATHWMPLPRAPSDRGSKPDRATTPKSGVVHESPGSASAEIARKEQPCQPLNT